MALAVPDYRATYSGETIFLRGGAGANVGDLVGALAQCSAETILIPNGLSAFSQWSIPPAIPVSLVGWPAARMGELAVQVGGRRNFNCGAVA